MASSQIFLKMPEQLQTLFSSLVEKIQLTPNEYDQLAGGFYDAFLYGRDQSTGIINKNIQNLSKKIDDLKMASNKSPTYAEKLKTSVIANSNHQVPKSTQNPHICLLYPKDPEKPLMFDDIKKILSTNLSNLHIKRFHPIRKSGFLIELKSLEDLNATKDLLTRSLNNTALFHSPNYRTPELRIKNIDGDITADEVATLFQAQNSVKLKETTSGKNCFITKTRFGRTDAIVLLPNPDFFNILKKGKAFLGFKSLDVCENFRISSCQTCFNTGHKSPECTKKNIITCSKCGNDHKESECTSPSKSCWRCIKYTQIKTPTHVFGSDNCVIFHNEKRRLTSITNYDC